MQDIRPVKRFLYTYPDNSQVWFEAGVTYEVDDDVFKNQHTQKHLAPGDRIDLKPERISVIGQPTQAVPKGQKPVDPDATDQEKLQAQAEAKAAADKGKAEIDKENTDKAAADAKAAKAEADRVAAEKAAAEANKVKK